MLSEKKLFLFDIDGTVALGDVLLPGAAEFFQEIKERGGQFVFITNNSTKSIADYIKKFRQMESASPRIRTPRIFPLCWLPTTANLPTRS